MFQNPYAFFLKLNKGRKCKQTGKEWTKLSFAQQVVYYQMSAKEITLAIH
jgi:hypothetical protein